MPRAGGPPTVGCMTALVVYESMYGSTKAVAEAIGEGLAAAGAVRVAEVSALAASPGGSTVADDVTLLVVGGPTHAFGMSRDSTRRDAARKAPNGVISTGKGLREWLEGLRTQLDGTPVAAFDTKVLRPNLPGSAAKAAQKHLRRLGGRPVVEPRSFRVIGTSDGLVDGELTAARTWGEELARTLA